MRCEPSIANLKFRVFYLTPIEGPPGRWRAILERKANGLMDVSRPVRTKAQQQDLSDSENFIHNLNPPLQSASNNQFCATESSRGFWHTRLLIGGQYMEVSRLTENTFGQVNDPFCLSVFIPNPIFLKSSFKYGRFKSVRCEVMNPGGTWYLTGVAPRYLQLLAIFEGVIGCVSVHLATFDLWLLDIFEVVAPRYLQILAIFKGAIGCVTLPPSIN